VDPDSVFKRRGFAGSAEEENTAARWTPAFPTDQVRGLKDWGTHSANDMAQELKGRCRAWWCLPLGVAR
jgi:hypothetical protein